MKRPRRNHSPNAVQHLTTPVFLYKPTEPPLSLVGLEPFFRWIKQHLRTKRFFGTSENAVKTKVWTAVAVYVLL